MAAFLRAKFPTLEATVCIFLCKQQTVIFIYHNYMHGTSPVSKVQNNALVHT